MRVLDKSFELYLEENLIKKRIQELADTINKDYRTDSPLFIGILNGCYAFMGDLMKNIDIPCELSFLKVSSYEGTESTKEVKELIGLNENVENRHLVLVEDIVDTGLTMINILESLNKKNPKSVEIASLLTKPESLKDRVNVKYKGFEIPDKFVIGYGLDYNGYGRNLNDIYQIVQ
ncbi:MAG: hypoxanthine phosphoribosyltransferase [Bacteroidota bacterium]